MKLWYIKMQDIISKSVEREILFSEDHNLAIRKDVAKTQKVMSPPQQIYLMETISDIAFVKEELNNPQNIVEQVELIGVPIHSLEPVIALFSDIDQKRREIERLEQSAMEWFDSTKPKA